MKSIITAVATTLVLLCAAPAFAQRDGRDAADRGQRLDLDAIRNDMLQRQLKVPEHPLVLMPPPAATQTPTKPAAKRKNAGTKN